MRPPDPEGGPTQAPIITSPRIYLVGAVTVLILGLNWPVMSWGVRLIPPLWITSFRLLGAALLVMVILAAKGRLRLPPREDYNIVASVAVIRLALVYCLAFTALLYVPPGRSSLLVHTSGLWAAPIAVVFLAERLDPLKRLGLVLGVGGIVLLMEPWNLSVGRGAALGYAMLLLAALASALGAVHVRGHRWAATALMLMPWQLLVAGSLTSVAALLFHGMPLIRWTGPAVAIVAYEVVLASGVGLWGTLTLSRSLPAVSTGVLLMAVPVIGVGSSVLLVGEPLTAAVVSGSILAFAGVAANIASDRRKGNVSTAVA